VSIISYLHITVFFSCCNSFCSVNGFSSVSFGTALTYSFVISFLVAWFANSICTIVTGAVEAAAAAIVISAADDRSLHRSKNAKTIQDILEKEKLFCERERDPAAGLLDHRVFGSTSILVSPEPSAPSIELQPQLDPPYPSASSKANESW